MTNPYELAWNDGIDNEDFDEAKRIQETAQQGTTANQQANSGEQEAPQEMQSSGIHSSGRTRTDVQRAIINSELFWYGGPRDSDDIHASLERPFRDD